MKWMLFFAICFSYANANEDLVKNGAFADGVKFWSETGSDEKREITVEQQDGAPVMRLTRKQAEASTMAVQYNIKFKPQTLYRFQVTGKGSAPVTAGLRPQSAKDPAYDKVNKSWATSTTPLPPSTDFITQTLIFDSGLKPDSAYISVALAGKDPGSYMLKKVSLEEVGSTKPRADETVILHIGDSISITSYLPFSERIHTLLDERFQKEFPGRAIRNINIAADGEYCKELFETPRYEKLVKENIQKIDIAVIRYGTNDCGHKFSPADFKANLAQLCDRLQTDYPGIQIVLGTGTFLYKSDDVNKRYGPYWQAIRDLTAERNYPLAEIEGKFEAEKSFKAVRSEGDMHPSAYGVQLATDAVYDVLKKIVSAK